MFKGTTFTTGGYSAEYGQALSSVLLLETEDIPEETATNIGANLAGLSLSRQQVWNEKTALIGSVSYTNLTALLNSLPTNVEWQRETVGYGSNLAFRHQGKNGIFKSLMQYQSSKMGLFDGGANPGLFTNSNRNVFWNTSYKGSLTDKLGIYAGVALNTNNDENTFQGIGFDERSRSLLTKVTLYHEWNETTSFKYGAETQTERDRNVFDGQSFSLNDQYSAIYSEGEVILNDRWALRLGARAEHSDALNSFNLAPRASAAYKTGEHSQVSLAYGAFYQKPEEEFLIENDQLDFERSTHLIANYQWIKDDQSFRVELYDKQYQDLVRTGVDGTLENTGDGFSRGVDIFWKDKKTFEGLDYWVSYSYVDAQRRYQDFPTRATPTFVTNHTLNIVTNYQIDAWSLTPGISYTFATGRTFENPNSERFLGDKTKAYHQLGINASYLTSLFGHFTVIYVAVTNPFGFDQVFGFEYSEDGSERFPIRPGMKRTAFVGLFISIK